MSQELDIEKTKQIILQKSTEEESKEFFRKNKRGITLFEEFEDISGYPHIETEEAYAKVLITDMKRYLDLYEDRSPEYIRYTTCVECGWETTRRIKHNPSIGARVSEYCGGCSKETFCKVDDVKEVGSTSSEYKVKTRLDLSQVWDVKIEPEIFEEFRKDFQKAADRKVDTGYDLGYFTPENEIKATLHNTIERDPKGSVRLFYIRRSKQCSQSGDIDVPGWRKLDTKMKDFKKEVKKRVSKALEKEPKAGRFGYTIDVTDLAKKEVVN